MSLAELEPLSGGAGWVGASLLSAVMAWLLGKHLPEKDRQIERLIAAWDERSERLLNRAIAELKEQRADFRACLEILARDQARRPPEGSD